MSIKDTSLYLGSIELSDNVGTWRTGLYWVPEIAKIVQGNGARSALHESGFVEQIVTATVTPPSYLRALQVTQQLYSTDPSFKYLS